jgi:hypothetical protein
LVGGNNSKLPRNYHFFATLRRYGIETQGTVTAVRFRPLQTPHPLTNFLYQESLMDAVHTFTEIHESPAAATTDSPMAQAASMMSHPAGQQAYFEASAKAGDTASSFLPKLPIDVENSASGADSAAAAGAYKDPITAATIGRIDFKDFEHIAMRKYDGSSYGTGLEEGGWEE